MIKKSVLVNILGAELDIDVNYNVDILLCQIEEINEQGDWWEYVDLDRDEENERTGYKFIVGKNPKNMLTLWVCDYLGLVHADTSILA